MIISGSAIQSQVEAKNVRSYTYVIIWIWNVFYRFMCLNICPQMLALVLRGCRLLGKCVLAKESVPKGQALSIMGWARFQPQLCFLTAKV